MEETAVIVKKETLRVALGTFILSAVMNLVFLVIGFWDLKVLFGSLLGMFTAILNFFLMCLTVKRAVDDGDQAKAVKRIKSSQILRLLMVFAIIAVAGIFRKTCFNIIAAVIPLIFPSIIIRIIKAVDAKKEKKENPVPAVSAVSEKTEALPETESADEMESVCETESADETETESVCETEPVCETETAEETENGFETKEDQD